MALEPADLNSEEKGYQGNWNSKTLASVSQSGFMPKTWFIAK